MKHAVLLFVVLFASAITAWCDTIDFWHVYVNHSMVADLTQPAEVVLSLKNIGNNDTLSVEYFKDTPCSCTTNLIIKNEDEIEKVVATTLETFDSLKVSVLELIKLSGNSGHLDVFHFDENGYKIKLFTLKFSA